MRNNRTGQVSIFFLDFNFNPTLRTLKYDDVSVDLRKKQSDVLSLLCERYPSAVFLEDFLKEVWAGSYVTSQSIAQVIRSLRIILKDESKNIIVTIPKLGYRLTAEPTWGKPQTLLKLLSENINECSPAVGMNSLPFKSHPNIPTASFPKTAMTVISYAYNHKPEKEKSISRNFTDGTAYDHI